MTEKPDLLNFLPEEIKELIKDMGYEGFRAEQIVKWLHRGIKDFNKMTDLPKPFRQKLQERFNIGSLEILEKRCSESRSAIKYLFLLAEHNIIECVVMRYRYGNTLCLSTQVGCRMGCKFCASTMDGLVRNLSAGEMLEQVLKVDTDLKEGGENALGNLVLMGSGEPLDNYGNTVKFLKMVHYPLGKNISYRNITISTCGLVPKIIQLSEEGLPVTLSVSLHAPNDRLRRMIMPVASAYSLADIIQASKYYFKKTGRRVTFEYSLIRDFNDGEEHAMELADRLKGFPCHVNIIPINEVDGLIYKRSSEASIKKFIEMLEYRGINVTRRRELGLDIEGACGQLKRSYLASYAQQYGRR